MRHRSALQRWVLAGVAVLALAGCETALPVVGPQTGAEPAQAASVEEGHPDKVLWGDLHVHSNLSFDSNSLGNERLGPAEAYRFAMGHPVTASSGQRAQLSRPLDFLMVADHAEYLGVLSSVRERDARIIETALGERWTGYMDSEDGLRQVMQDYVAMVTRQKPMDLPGDDHQRMIWHDMIEAAERYHRPGEFTTLAGYEWTSMPGGRNLHRVVVFRDGPERTRQVVPFSALDSDDPEDLWDYLERYETLTGGQVLAIAHNGNLSGGLMFDDETLDGSPLTEEYASRRQRWEPVYEVTQVKGDGEAHPLLSPDDRFADFETWFETDITMRPRSGDPAEARESLAGEYAREGLKKGLRYDAQLGMNPYQFGLIGSTDAHTALATADDDNFWGKFRDSEPGPERSSNQMGGNLWENAGLSASGYTAVWARANTREEIFDALMRREVYATTGPRMRLRLFAGWEFSASDFGRDDFVDHGYASGVPMGGVIRWREGAAVPTFLIRALKDPEGAMIERAQIVKGWLDEDGELRERVFDLEVASDDGVPGMDVFWRDPSFDPDLRAFYYVRLLQVPTKRWTTVDAERYGVAPPAGVPRLIQERAYSSPVWYRPSPRS
ncbi:MAG: DUF3604 domain-containing protein [Erythrobacter sp.]